MEAKSWKEIKDTVYGAVGTERRDELERDFESFKSYLGKFDSNQVPTEPNKNGKEVTGEDLQLLENEENKIIALRNAIQEGIDSGIVHDFDPDKHLAKLKAEKRRNG